MKPLLKIATAICIVLSTCSVTAQLSVEPIPDGSQVYPISPNWTGERVLHIGDSHLANKGLTLNLREKFSRAGAHYYVNSWIGSRSKSWLTSGRLRRALEDKRPSTVLVTLGTNALKNKRPDKYADWIKGIRNKIGNRKCYWIAPPALIEDKYGFYDVLKQNAAPCKVFDSRTIQFKTSTQNVYHLSHNQAGRWADHIWAWMNELPPPAEQPHGI